MTSISFPKGWLASATLPLEDRSGGADPALAENSNRRPGNSPVRVETTHGRKLTLTSAGVLPWGKIAKEHGFGPLHLVNINMSFFFTLQGVHLPRGTLPAEPAGAAAGARGSPGHAGKGRRAGSRLWRSAL